MRALPGKIKRKVGRLLGRKAEGGDHSRPPTASPELRERAAKDIREYAEENEVLFNRASRFEEKAERLQSSDGTIPSESAQRRAERARAEILAELSDLRSSFASAHGDEGRLAFDAELETLYPRLVAPDDGG